MCASIVVSIADKPSLFDLQKGKQFPRSLFVLPNIIKSLYCSLLLALASSRLAFVKFFTNHTIDYFEVSYATSSEIV